MTAGLYNGEMEQAPRWLNWGAFFSPGRNIPSVRLAQLRRERNRR